MSFSPAGIDHLIYASPDLERGMDDVESILGVRPVPGGRHPRYGTHNALLSLGDGVYLEVMARDAGLPAPERGSLIDLPDRASSRLVTWVLRSSDIRQAADAAVEAGVGIGSIGEGRRENPDGSSVSWQLTDPYAMPLGGAVPFLISWGDSPHPSIMAPPGGRLVAFTIGHPQPADVQQALGTLGAEVPVTTAPGVVLSATIETVSGSTVILR